METYIYISIVTFWLTSSLIMGYLLWIKRKEVPDRSRTFLSISYLSFIPGLFIYILMISAGKADIINTVLHQDTCIVGLYAISIILYYPLEIMRPRWLTGWKLVIPITPAILVTIPLFFGIEFLDLHSFNDIKEHWMDFDVLLRLIAIFFLGIITLFILIIPYNWRKSSADRRLIRRYVLLAEITSVIYCFSGTILAADINILWGIILFTNLCYYELTLRIIPPSDTQHLPDEPEPIQEDQDDEDRADDLWQRISHQMEKHELWRNPDATVEIMSRAVGTNRIYVADCIREHTGLTFNDYLNKWRTEYMADKLRLDPGQDQKPLYFEIGYRNRQTAYRNFIKFIGCSPSDFIASL